MKFTPEKKQAIETYIIEKIEQKEKSLSALVIENFNINETTFYKYINDLQERNIIKKTARGQYRLAAETFRYHLTRSGGDLDRDTIAYDKCLHKHVRNFENNVERIWTYAFSEMTNNIMDHSNAENVDVIVEQSYPVTTVWLIDDGIGIFNKIREYFKLNSIDDAVDELFKGKITTDSKNHSGEGIFFSSRMMDEFYIISDNRIFSHNKYNQDMLLSAEQPFKTGTAVMMKLSNFSKKTPRDIFSQFENEDGEFDKTEIKLKMIFGTAAISRSQAKRLCNGLNRFNKIILDFEDIEWMGQGFADQVFRVFASEHPGIMITPIHMNEDVRKMYNHACPADLYEN